MKTRSILILLLIVLATNVRAQLPASYANALQHTLDSFCKRYKLQGATAAVYVPEYGTWEGTHGESHAGVPMTSGMALPLNSNTKTYVAAALLKLQEAGKLSLDDSIGTWIRNKQHIDGKITIRQMLNHTSGIYSYTDTLDFADSVMSDFSRIWKPEEMLKFVGPSLFTRGTNWSYSNTNYLLAGMIIAQVSGKPVEQAMRDILLTPNGLASTWFYPQEQPTGVIPHFWFDNGAGVGMDGDLFGYTPESFYSGANAAGALFSTAKDNVIFWQKLISGKVLNAASMAEWRRIVALNGSIGYGLGMFRYRNFNSRVVYEHGGTGAGAINENLADSSSGVCISLLTNQEVVSNSTLFDVIVKALHRVTMAPPTSVAGIAATTGWKVFPIPATTALSVHGDAASQAGLRYVVRDFTGRIVREQQLEAGRIGLDGMANGSYMLELRSEAGSLGARRFEVLR